MRVPVCSHWYSITSLIAVAKTSSSAMDLAHIVTSETRLAEEAACLRRLFSKGRTLLLVVCARLLSGGRQAWCLKVESVVFKFSLALTRAVRQPPGEPSSVQRSRSTGNLLQWATSFGTRVGNVTSKQE